MNIYRLCKCIIQGGEVLQIQMFVSSVLLCRVSVQIMPLRESQETEVFHNLSII